MKKGIYFVTGFPGFLSMNIVKELIHQDKASVIYLLHLEHLTEEAMEMTGSLKGNTEAELILLKGDITQPDLGINRERLQEVQESVEYVWHLAAIYDLAVHEDLAYKVNVEGTKQVNSFCQTLQHLKRYVYFSTAFVAGTRKGEILEDELIHPGDFHNFYERTKYEAEESVRELMGRLPITIIRPGIVKGNSETGETIKFDGPYFIMNMFKRLSFLPWIPVMGDGRALINIVPVEYVVKASIYLGHYECGSGKTYHITDPHPLTVREVYEQILWHMYKKQPSGRIPLSLSNWALGFRFVRRYLKVEREALDYLTFEGVFNCRTAQEDLKNSGIICPSLSSQMEKMVEFYLDHSTDEALHIKIN
ncbi:SDR family oxidoreductase [Bacillus sp. RO3]|nr:SDR family oxidoreductase [Bacillus sp. RO3]